MKVTASGLVSVAFSVGNIIGPLTFQARDAPDYKPAKITLVAVAASGVLVATAIRILYGIRNSQADRVGGPAQCLVEKRLARYKDHETNVEAGEEEEAEKTFRYVY